MLLPSETLLVNNGTIWKWITDTMCVVDSLDNGHNDSLEYGHKDSLDNGHNDSLGN